MAFEVAAWNVAAGLDKSDKAPQIIEGIKRLDADYVVLSEASRQPELPIDPDYFHREGYHWVMVPYEDDSPHPTGLQNLIMLNRFNEPMRQTRLATRNGIRSQFEDPETSAIVEVVGAHFDDRFEYLRLQMSRALLKKVDMTEPIILAGDFNAMHGSDYRARLLSHLFGNAHRVPQGKHPKIDRFRSLATRLHGMAEGQTIIQLLRGGFLEADPKHRATMKLGPLAVAQLDHIMHSRRLKSSAFQVHNLSGADHKAISSTLKVI